ncbi:hypothetical protein SteCoe_27031 [Stentor coeruleus]|uniref:Vacuolar ATPase assembly integral membrane protein VMA21 homolog n=1 Tax=Stentor coeruleus TaxID=5963 RepID=A0A1R2BBE2_9CILI|nr:hypothetical protein SteCoe_27031 [Stentor coeruleus]
MLKVFSSPASRLLLAAVLFVTVPAIVFFATQNLTSNMKSSSSEAISAMATVIAAHIIIAFFIYTAYNIEVSKDRTD